MKKFIAIAMAFTMLLCLFACKKTDDSSAEKTDVRVMTLKGPTGIGMAKLMADNDAKIAKNNYTFTLTSVPADVSAAVIGGNFDIAAVPVNLAAVLYNKGADIEFLAVNTLGVLYILENGDTIKSVEDLRGKKLYATGQGSTPQYVLEYVLEKNGIKVGEDITIEYLEEHAALASQLAAGSVSIGMLPEPNVTSAMMASSSLRIALDLTEEFGKVSESTLVQGVIIASKSFVKAHPDAVKSFMSEYEASVSYVNSDIESAAAYCETYEIVPKAAVAKKAIPNCNICFKSGDEGKALMKNMLSMLFDANPASVGGKLPDESFYG